MPNSENPSFRKNSPEHFSVGSDASCLRSARHIDHITGQYCFQMVVLGKTGFLFAFLVMKIIRKPISLFQHFATFFLTLFVGLRITGLVWQTDWFLQIIILFRSFPFSPIALVLTAINPAMEEAYYSCSVISPLYYSKGKTHTLLLPAVLFGLWHWFYGSPPGLIRSMMVGFLAWLLGKTMLETQGFVYPFYS